MKKKLINLEHLVFTGMSNFSLDTLTCYRLVNIARSQFDIFRTDPTLG